MSHYSLNSAQRPTERLEDHPDKAPDESEKVGNLDPGIYSISMCRKLAYMGTVYRTHGERLLFQRETIKYLFII